MRNFKYAFLLFLSTTICHGSVGQTLVRAGNQTIKHAIVRARGYATDVNLKRLAFQGITIVVSCQDITFAQMQAEVDPLLIVIKPYKCVLPLVMLFTLPSA